MSSEQGEQETNENPQIEETPRKKSNKGSTLKSAKSKKVSGEDAELMILDYLRQQCRPFNSTKVFENLNKRIGQSDVLKILDSLCDNGKIMKKTEGKSALYWISLGDSNLDELQAKLAQLAESKTDIEEDLEKEEYKHAQLQNVKQQLANEPSDTQLHTLIQDEKSLIVKLQAQIEEKQYELSNVAKMIQDQNPENLEDLKRQYDFYHNAGAKMKRQIMDVLMGISESSGMQLKTLIDSCGIIDDDEISNK